MKTNKKLWEEWEEFVIKELCPNKCGHLKFKLKKLIENTENRACREGVKIGFRQSREMLREVLDEVEKEHGSSNVYLDMVGDLFIEKIEALFIKNN